MKRTTVLCVALIGLSAGVRAQESKSADLARSDDRPKAAVMSIVAEKGVDEGTIRLLNEIVLSEVDKTGRFCDLIGEQDIIAMLSLEEKRIQLQGCVDESCMAEIGGALGVNFLVSGRVGQVGERFVLNIKLLNVKQAKVAGRSSVITAPDETKLLTAARAAVREAVLGEQITAELSRELKTVTPVAPVVTAASEPEGPSNFALYGRWVALGLTVAAGATAGAMAGLAAADHSAMDDEVRGTPAWGDLKDSGETKAVAADAMFGVAGAAAAATIVLFLLAVDWSDDAPPPAQVGVMPLREGGGVFTLGLRFDPGVTR